MTSTSTHPSTRLGRTPRGTVLAGAMLISMAIAYVGFTLPSAQARLALHVARPLALLVVFQDVVNLLVYVAMLTCGVLILRGWTKGLTLGILLVLAAWVNNVLGSLATHVYSAIWPLTVLSIVLLLPLIIAIIARRSHRVDYGERTRKTRALFVSELALAGIVTVSTVVVSTVFALTMIKDAFAPKREELTVSSSVLQHELSTLQLHMDTRSISQRPSATVVSFWATWCAPCIDELPSLQRLYDNFRVSNVRVLLVNIDMADRDTARQFLAERGVNIPCAVDLEGSSFEKLKLEGLPSTILVNQKEEPVHLYVGSSSLHLLEEDLGEIIDNTLKFQPAVGNADKPSSVRTTGY